MLIQKNAGWKVVIGDLNVKGGEAVAEKLGNDCVFVKCDASNYDDVVNIFETAQQKFGRVDFGTFLLPPHKGPTLRKSACMAVSLVKKLNSLVIVVAANAGIAESMDLTKPINVAAGQTPPKPNLKTVDVNLYGPLYAAYLAVHYFRTNSPATGGRYVVTSSAAGLYGHVDLPLYSAAKFGCVGLVRSLGLDRRCIAENITFNAICPGWVETGLAPPGMIEFVRQNCAEIITPMSTIMRAYNIFLDSNVSAQAYECTGELAEPRPEPDVFPLPVEC